MSKKLLLIVNPCAGQKKPNKHLTDILNIFAVQDYECTVQLTSLTLSAEEIVNRYGKDKDLIICIGGDGTFNQTVAGVLDLNLETTLGYIPSGSTNDVASNLGLSTNPVKAAQSISTGTLKSVDVGLFNSRPFTYVASFGMFTKTSYTTSRNLKNSLGHFAYILSGIKELADIKSYHVEIKTKDNTYAENYLFGAICNSRRLAGGMIKLPEEAVDLNDGVFEVFLISVPKNAAEYMQLILDLQRSNMKSKFFRLFSASSCEIKAPENMDWTIDGEYEKGCENIKIENLHSAISILT